MRILILYSLFLFLSGFGSATFAQTLHPLLSDIPDNTAKDLGPYACSSPQGDNGVCSGITDFSGFTYDPYRQQMLMFGGGHATTYRDDVDVFHFDTLTWQPAYTPTPCSQMNPSNFDADKRAWISTGHPGARHTYDLLVATTNTKEFLLLSNGFGNGHCEQLGTYPGGGRVGHYNPDTKKWTFGPNSNPPDSWSKLGSAEFDPQSGLVVIVDQHTLWTYDPVNRAKTKRLEHNAQNLGYANNLVYFPPNGNMYYIARGNPTLVFEINLDRTNWSKSTVTRMNDITGMIPSTQESGFAYDPYNKIIGGGIQDGKFYAFDPIGKSWKVKTMNTKPTGSSIGTLRYHAIDFDPVNNVFIFMSGPYLNVHTWAYRYANTVPTGAPVAPVNLNLNIQ